jgi:hypothetical protein
MEPGIASLGAIRWGGEPMKGDLIMEWYGMQENVRQGRGERMRR